MNRTLIILAAVAATAVCAERSSAAPPTITPGEELKAELTQADKTKLNAYRYPLPGTKKFSGRGVVLNMGFAAEYPITLKAGQPLRIAATVAGEDRQVAVVLIDPSGEIVTGTVILTKSAILDVSEVAASGAHKIAVYSNRVGSFSLRVTGPSGDELDAKALEAKIAELKRELADAEAKLKALKAKKP